jgi:hypothetical protein
MVRKLFNCRKCKKPFQSKDDRLKHELKHEDKDYNRKMENEFKKLSEELL